MSIAAIPSPPSAANFIVHSHPEAALRTPFSPTVHQARDELDL